MVRLTERPYQRDAVFAARQAYLDGYRAICIEGPTGCGKTFIGALIAEGVVEKNRDVLWLTHRRVLAGQSAEGLREHGLPVQVIMAGYDEPSAPVQVCSKDTLWARQYVPKSAVIIVDEGHIATSKTVLYAIQQNPKAFVILLTATPAAPNGKSLPCEKIIKAATYKELIADGYLVPTKVYAPDPPDLKGCPRRDGEWVMGAEMGKACAVLVGQAHEHWVKWGEGRQFILFSDRVHNSRETAAKFCEAGIPCGHVDGTMAPNERSVVMDAFHSGELTGVCNVDVLSIGYNFPALSCCINARPTQSLVWYRQSANRIQRPYPGKEYAIYIDMTGTVYKLGFPDSDIDWPEPGKSNISELKECAEHGKEQEGFVICRKCQTARRRGMKCPACGHVAQIIASKSFGTEYLDGQLIHVDRVTLKRGQEQASGQKLYSNCVAIAANTGRPLMAAFAMYNKQTNEWPSDDFSYVPKTATGDLDKASLDMSAATLYPGFVRRKKG